MCCYIAKLGQGMTAFELEPRGRRCESRTYVLVLATMAQRLLLLTVDLDGSLVI